MRTGLPDPQVMSLICLVVRGRNTVSTSVVVEHISEEKCEEEKWNAEQNQ